MYNEEMLKCLDDLDKLNELYDKEYCTIEEFVHIKNRIVDKMIELSNKEKSM